MSNAGYRVVIYVEEQVGNYYVQNQDIEIVQEKHFFKNYYTRRFQQVFQLRRHVAEIRPDLIISFQTNQNALSVLATFGRKIPVVISERGDPYHYDGFVASVKRWIINHAEGGVFQSQNAMNYFSKKLQQRSRVIKNPTTVQSVNRPSWEDRSNEIVSVGRFDIQQKRQDILVEAFALVAQQFPDYILGFYGTGQDEDIIKIKVKELGLENRVVFHGLVRDIPEAILKSKLFVLTSDYEGMPNALIEAMSLGLPCLTTDYSPGVASELINSGFNGIIVPRGDVKALAENMSLLLDNPEIADRLGLEAQKVAEVLRPEKIYSEWEEYIRSVLRIYGKNLISLVRKGE